MKPPAPSYYAFYFLGALTVSLAVTPAMRQLAFRIGALDRGEGRRAHEGVVPRLGGGGIYAGFALLMGFALVRIPWGPTHDTVAGILVAATLVFVLGLHDDRRGAPIRNKIGIEIAAAMVLYGWGVRVENLTHPFGGPTIELGWFALPATVLWVLIVTNAFNLIDGLDGLAGSTGILIAVALLLLGPGRDVLLTLACVTLIGSLAGFLRYNFPPSTIFMGDSGSLFTGFVLSALSIVASAKATAMMTVLVPIVVFAHPLMDMVYAVLRRYKRGLPLGEADREHIHHKLLDMGFSRRRALGTLVGLNLLVLGLVVFVAKRHLQGDFLLAVILLALSGVGLKLLGYLRIGPHLGDDARVLFRGRRQRYLSYLIGRFSREAKSIRTSQELERRFRELLQESTFTAAEVSWEVPGEGEWQFMYGVAETQGPDVRIEFPVRSGGRRIGLVVLRAPASLEPPACAGELSAALAAGLASFAEERQAPQAPVPGDAGGVSAADEPGAQALGENPKLG